METENFSKGRKMGGTIAHELFRTRLPVVLALLSLLVSVRANAAPVTITFDDQPANTIVTNQYQSQGVLFNGNFIANFGPTHSGTQALDLTSPGNDVTFGPIEAVFTRPMTTVSLFAGSPFQSGQQGTLSAFDSTGALIARDGPKALGTAVDIPFSISVASPTIARIQFSQTPFRSPRIDDLSFDDGGASGVMPITGVHFTPVNFVGDFPVTLGGSPTFNTQTSIFLGTIVISQPGGTGSNGGTPILSGISSCTGSRANNISWTYEHDADDYLTDAGTQSSSCGLCGCDDSNLNPLPGQLKHLRIRRIFRPNLGYVVSSFGPTMFGTFDTKIRLFPASSGGQPTIDVFDVRSDVQPATMLELSPADGDNAVDGVYHDVAGRQYKDLRVVDALGHLLPQPVAGAQAILTFQTGERYSFEIIDTSGGNGVLDGRLIRSEDRNRNGEVITYVYSATATDAQLGFDRTRLWQIKSIADVFGATATFEYNVQQVSGRWVVSKITVPTGHALQYGYAGSATVGLSSVGFDDGTTSSFSTFVDATNQEVGIAINDNAAGESRVKKTVFVSQATVTLPSGQVVSQPSGLVRRVINGSGEMVYRNWEDPSHANVYYIYEGGGSLNRVTVGSDAFPQSFARASLPFNPNNDPSTMPFDTQATYTEGPAGQLASVTDATARTYTLTRDPLTRAVTGATYFDGSSATSTYNQFRDPVHVVDNVGKVTNVSYDANGNITSMSVASGTPAVATPSWTYNSRGQPLSSKDANGNVTSYQYDAVGNLTTVTEPPDAVGGAGAVTKYTYDSAGRTLTKTDPEGRTTTYTYDARNRISTKSYPDGSNEIFAYGSGSTANLLVSHRDRNGHLDTYSYDDASRPTGIVRASGMPESISDAWTYLAGTTLRAQETKAGNQTAFLYDQRRRMVAKSQLVTPTLTLTESVAYDLIDRKIQKTDAYGRSTFYGYDQGGRQTRVVSEQVPGAVPQGTNIALLTRPSGPNPGYTITDHTYDSQGRMILKTDGRGINESSAYDAQGRVSQKVVAAGTADAAKTTYQYDAQGNRVLEARPRSFDGEGPQFATAYAFSKRNLLLSETAAVGTADAATTRYTYTPTRQKATVTDGRGNVSSYAYDTCCNRLSQVTDQTGQKTTYTYDFNGNRASTMDPNNNTTHYTYDALNRQTIQTDARGKVTTTTYDDNLADGVGVDAKYGPQLAGLSFGSGAAGSAVVTTDPLGDVNIAIKDPLGRPLRTLDGNLNATTTTYDVVVDGLLEEATTDALAHTKRIRTDGSGLGRETVDAAGNLSTFAFDADGNQVQTRDPNGVGQDCLYTARNLASSCTDTKGDTTSQTYDVENNQIAKVDGLGKTSQCIYDARNRKKSCTDRLGGVQSYVYDANSNLLQTTDPDGSPTAYQYDPRNLKVQVTFADGGVRKSVYDPARRLTAYTQQDGSVIAFSYDTVNRLIGRHYSDNKDDVISYDDANRIVEADSARYQTTVRRAYDPASRVVSDSQTVFGTSHIVSYAYDAANKVKGFTYPDGSTVSRTYTERNQLASVASNAATLESFIYDPGQRMISASIGNGTTETRTYQSDNQIASLATAGLTGFSYAYDANKRKLTENDAVATVNSQAFAYDNEDRVANWSRQTGDTQSWQLSLANDWQKTTRNAVAEVRTHSPAHEVKTSNGASLSYDAKGNLTADARGHLYTWDVDNRLSSASTGGVVTTYVYDAFGRRLGKKTGSTSVTLVNADEQVVTEYAGSTLLRKYVYGDYVDKPVALISGNVTYYYSQNHLYSVAALVSSGGAIAERYRYDAYGGRTVLKADGSSSQVSAVGNPFGFTGRYHDDESGLIYFRGRYYDPFLGRFITRDKEFRDGPNLYAAYFVPNHLDPTGEGVKVGFSGQANLQFTVCKGGSLDGVLKGWAGVGYEAWGVFLGWSWSGTSKPINIAKEFVTTSFDCGTSCAPNCCDASGNGTSSSFGPTASTGGGASSIVTNMINALSAGGVKCGESVSANPCSFNAGIDCSYNAIQTLLGPLGPLVGALKDLGVSIEAGLHLGGSISLCMTPDGSTALQQLNISGGAYVKIGVGL